MKSFFVKAPHWLLFIIIYIIPYALMFGIYFYAIFEMIQTEQAYYEPQNLEEPYIYENNARDSFNSFMGMMMLMYIPLVIGYLAQALWKYHFANFCNSRLPVTHKTNLSKFNWLVFIPTAVYIILLGLSYYWMGDMDFFESDVMPSGFLYIMLASLVGYALIGVAFFYCLVVACKPYKTAVTLKSSSFSDFVGEFFCLWFSFVGLWIMQPKINKLANGTLHNSNENTFEHLIE